jgi:hypothetical protein
MRQKATKGEVEIEGENLIVIHAFHLLELDRRQGGPNCRCHLPHRLDPPGPTGYAEAVGR